MPCQSMLDSGHGDQERRGLDGIMTCLNRDVRGRCGCGITEVVVQIADGS